MHKSLNKYYWRVCVVNFSRSRGSAALCLTRSLQLYLSLIRRQTVPVVISSFRRIPEHSSLSSHTQYVRRDCPHLLSRNAVGGAARLVSNFGNDRSAAGFAKKGKCRPRWSCLDYFEFFLRTFVGFNTFSTHSTASADPSTMSEDLSSQPWSINKDDYELHEVIGMWSVAC